MSGWQWCPGAQGQCATCRRFLTGLWRFYVGLTSHKDVCADCAEALEAAA